MSINNVVLIGNMTRDPELNTLSSGKSKTTFSIACNRTWKDQSGAKKEKTTFVDITVWGNMGNAIVNYTRKGSKIGIQGRLEQDFWEDRNTGQKRSKLYVVADNVQFLDNKQTQGQQNQNQGGWNNQNQNKNQNQGNRWGNPHDANSGGVPAWNQPPEDEPPF